MRAGDILLRRPIEVSSLVDDEVAYSLGSWKLEDLSLVLIENLDPRSDVAGVVARVVGYSYLR